MSKTTEEILASYGSVVMKTFKDHATFSVCMRTTINDLELPIVEIDPHELNRQEIMIALDALYEFFYSEVSTTDNC